MRKTKVHFTKILSEFFVEVESKYKPFEIRKDDRDYQTGDIIVLQEIVKFNYSVDGIKNENVKYTDKYMIYEIGYVTKYAQQQGYVVFGLRNPCDSIKTDIVTECKKLQDKEIDYSEFYTRMKKKKVAITMGNGGIS